MHQDKLPPRLKFILVVLADAADDQGVCWPRISTVARNVGVSTRTVQRAIQYLVRQKLVTVQPQLRPDGSSSSNRYQLSLEEGVKLSPTPDKLTPPPDATVTHPRHRCQGEGDTRVTPLTERRTEREPPPRIQGIKPEASRPPDRGGGDQEKENPDLSYPEALLPAERDRAAVLVGSLDPPLQQQVLDEWAGIIAAGDIRKSSLGCLRALVRHAREGSFTLERGIRVAQSRRTRQRVAAQAEQVPELVEADESNPLIHRILEIRQRSREP